MDLQLTGARVLVTGGTRGIGRATVGAFVDEGAVVEFCARDAGEIEVTEKEITEREGQATGVLLDVRDGPALTSWVEAAAGRLGGLDAVVANASALTIPDTEENWYTSFEVDLCTRSGWRRPPFRTWSAAGRDPSSPSPASRRGSPAASPGRTGP